MKILNYCLAFFAITALTFISCEEEPDPILAPVVTSIVAEGTSFEDGSTLTKDLNGASSATDVALKPQITITLDKAVDASTVNVSNVSLSDGSEDVSSNVSSTGSTITITPQDELKRGTQYTLNLNGIQSNDGGNLAGVTRTFVTEGRAPVVVPKAEDQIAYWNFDGQMMDQVGSFDPDNSVAIEFGTDRFGQGGSTATFDGDESIIEIPGADALMASDSWTAAYWMKTNSDGHVNQDGNPSSYFVMGLGAFNGFQFEVRAALNELGIAAGYQLGNGGTDSEGLFFNGNGQDKDNGGWQGWDVSVALPEGGVEDMIKDKWVHVVYSYNADEQQGRLYLNGDLMKGFDFELWPDCAEPGTCKQSVTGVAYRENTDVEPILALGFIKSIDSPLWADTPWGDYAKPTANH